MKKNIWILNHYASGMFFQEGGRHYALAKYLKRQGYSPVIFGANAKHGIRERFIDTDDLYVEKIAEDIGVPFVFLKCTTYDNNGLDRIKSMFSYFINVQRVALKYAKKNEKPDIIYASSVHPLALVAGLILSKFFRVKCICEVRDLWPESIVAYSKKLTKSNPIIKLLYCGEKWIYKNADAIIFTMEGAYNYIKNQGWDDVISEDKVFFINNGVDLEAFNHNKENFIVEDDDLNSDSFKVVYTGSIKLVNNVGKLLDAAKQLENIKFLIWGSGNEEEALKQRVVDENINNVIFKGRVEKKYIPSILSKSDANIYHDDQSSITAYGLCLNKLFEYMASGKPVITDVITDYDPAVNLGCGFTIDNIGDDIVVAIRKVVALNKDEYKTYCDNAIKGASKYSFSNLTDDLINIIETI